MARSGIMSMTASHSDVGGEGGDVGGGGKGGGEGGGGSGALLGA